MIDLGCDPGTTWTQVGDAVAALRDRGMRVSIDSFDPAEVALAVAAGAELVLSVNASNRAHAPEWGVEVVAIPDQPGSLEGLDQTIEFLVRQGVPFRIDPILEPIGFGFAASLGRYLEVRRRYPEAAMIMGVGNLTELTDVDSAGVNTILARVLSGAEDPERPDDGRHQLGAVVGARARPGPPAGSSCRDAPHLAQAPRAASRRLARSQGRRVRRRQPGRAPAADPRPQLADLRRGGNDLCPQQRAVSARSRSVRALRADGRRRCRACVLPRLRADEGENRLDAEQDLSPGSSAGVGLPDRARSQPPRAATGTRSPRSRAAPERSRRPMPRTSRTQTRRARDSRRDRDNAEPRRRTQHRADGTARSTPT